MLSVWIHAVNQRLSLSERNRLNLNERYSGPPAQYQRYNEQD